MLRCLRATPNYSYLVLRIPRAQSTPRSASTLSYKLLSGLSVDQCAVYVSITDLYGSLLIVDCEHMRTEVTDCYQRMPHVIYLGHRLDIERSAFGILRWALVVALSLGDSGETLSM